jgi:hypothetical protein
MAYSNFKKCLKMAFGPLGVKIKLEPPTDLAFIAIDYKVLMVNNRITNFILSSGSHCKSN